MKNRQKFIGASDIHHVFSLPPYGCARRLQYEKTGQPTDYPQVENEHIRRGKFYEPIALKEYKKQTETRYRKSFTLQHTDYPFMVAHPDALTTAELLPIEVKCPTRRNFEKIKHEGLSEAYILQIQYQIALARVPQGISVNFCPETTELLHFEIQEDWDLMAMIFAKVREFWEEAVKGKGEIKKLDPTDRRCQTCLWRKTCQGEALVVETTEGLVVDDSLTPLAEEYKQARAIVSEAEEYLDDVQGRLTTAMGDRVAVETPGSRIYYRPQESWRWDTKALSMAHPELEKEFKKKSISRPLRVFSI